MSFTNPWELASKVVLILLAMVVVMIQFCWIGFCGVMTFWKFPGPEQTEAILYLITALFCFIGFVEMVWLTIKIANAPSHETVELTEHHSQQPDNPSFFKWNGFFRTLWCTINLGTLPGLYFSLGTLQDTGILIDAFKIYFMILGWSAIIGVIIQVPIIFLNSFSANSGGNGEAIDFDLDI